jgi:DNA-binding GntR family transcriptional regulator
MFDTEGLARTLADRVAETLAERIVGGEYAPGDRLIEATIAKSLNVSHGPIRDALRLLQSAGLVTISAYKGACVTELTERELSEIYQARAALSGLRARWLAEDAERLQRLGELEAAIAKLGELASDPAARDAYTAAALQVSRQMTGLLTNRWLRSLMDSLTLQTNRYTRLALASPQRRRASARQWRAVLEAIRAGDADRAQSLATALSLSTRDAALAALGTMRESAQEPMPKRVANSRR